MLRHKLSLFVALALAVSSAGCGGGDDSAPPAANEETTPSATEPQESPAEPVVVELKAVNDSGISGTARLTEREGSIASFAVAIELAAAGDASHPAHIHDVTCAEYAEITDFNAELATVVDTLSDVRAGSEPSSSTVPGELGERTAGGFSINVHTPAHPFPAVACGDIPAAGG